MILTILFITLLSFLIAINLSDDFYLFVLGDGDGDDECDCVELPFSANYRGYPYSCNC